MYICTYCLLIVVDCLLIAHAHDVSQGMGQGMPMTRPKTWALLKAAHARGASFFEQDPCLSLCQGHALTHALAHIMSMDNQWASHGQPVGNQ